MNRELAGAWTSWKEVASDAAEAKRQLMAAASSMRNVGSRKALNAWISVAQDAAEAKRKLRAAAASIRNSGTRKALNAWVSVYREAREALAAMRRSASCMMNRELAGAWTAWSEQWREARDALAAMRRSMGFMRNRGLAGAWVQWSKVLLASADAAAAAQRRMRQAAMALGSLKLRRAYTSWADAVASSHEQADLLVRAIAATLSRRLHRSLRLWRGRTSQRALLQGLGRLAANLLSNGARRAMRTWVADRALFKSRATRTKGLHLLRAAESLTLADAVLRRLHHWRAVALWCRMHKLRRAVDRVQQARGEKLKHAEVHMEALNVRLHRQEALTKAATARHERAEGELVSAKAKLVRLEAHKESMQAMLKTREAETIAANEKVTRLDAKLNSKHSKQRGKEERAGEEIAKLSEQLRATQDALRNAEARADQLALRCQESEAECRDALSKHDAADEQVRRSNAATLEARRVADERVRQAEERAAEAMRQSDARAYEMEERLRSASAAESERSHARGEMEARLESQAALMNEELVRVATQLKQARQEAAATAQRETAAAARAIEMEREVSRLTTELNTHHAQASQERAAALAAVNERSDVELEVARRHVATLEREGSELRHALKRLSSPLGEARQTLWQQGWTHGFEQKTQGSPPPPPPPPQQQQQQHAMPLDEYERSAPAVGSPPRYTTRTQGSPPTRYSSPNGGGSLLSAYAYRPASRCASRGDSPPRSDPAADRRASWLPSPQGPGGEWGGGWGGTPGGAMYYENGHGVSASGGALQSARMEYADAARQLDERLDELRRFVASEPSLSMSPPGSTPGPRRANVGGL